MIVYQNCRFVFGRAVIGAEASGILDVKGLKIGQFECTAEEGI